ncbi:MAG: four helix bundle protein [Terriglobales bacterium]
MVRSHNYGGIMQGHRDLIVWQKSMQFVTHVHQVTKRYPKDETFALSIQTRRAAVSIPSNLAEGHGRSSTPEFHHFVSIARGSLLEAETQIEIARNLGYIDEKTFRALLKESNEIGRMLTGLRSWAAGANS